jgi:hypothetical protein
MSYDLVTWSPRVGSSGDDLYNVPGATKLDLTVDSGSKTKIYAGDATGANPGSLADFSDYTNASLIPTIAQINASAGVNQVIGLLNRRIKMWNALAGTSMSAIAYVAASASVTAAKFNAICSAITTLRSTEGFTAYTFPGTSFGDGNICVGCKVYGYHLANMRKALCLSGTQTISVLHFWWYGRTDNPWGTAQVYNDTMDYIAAGAGLEGSTNGQVTLHRDLFYFLIPDYVSNGGSPAFSSAKLVLNLGQYHYYNTAFDLELFSSNGNTYPPTFTLTSGSAYENDNAEGSTIASSSMPANPSLSSFNFTLSNTNLVNKANAKIRYIMMASSAADGMETLGPTMGGADKTARCSFSSPQVQISW